MRRAILTFSPWSLGLKKISILVADSEYILHLARKSTLMLQGIVTVSHLLPQTGSLIAIPTICNVSYF